MNIPNKEDVLKKWAPILDNMGVTGSKASWMSEYAEMHSKNESELSTTTLNSTSEDFPSLLPISKKIVAKTVGLDLVSVKPMSSPGGTSEETMERIKTEVKAENRERKINNVLEDEDFKEMDITEHPDYNGPVGNLFYLDYSYGGSTQSNTIL